MSIININSRNIAFFIIFLLAATTRSVGITQSPPSVYVDETVIGYNAYSLTETGRDEYGKKWPVFLRSYGAFSSSLYTFVTAPIVKVLGLNTISVRLLSIISGVFLVVLVAWQWGLIAAWLTAIAPVFVFFSRGAFEANFALTLLMAGLFSGIRYLRSANKVWLLLLSSSLFALSTYAYLAERVIAPLLLLTICFIDAKCLVRKKMSILPIYLSLALFVFISLPMLKVSFTSGANQRLQTLLPQNDPSHQVSELISRYYAYFSPQNLFSRPDPDQQRSFPEISVFYWWWIFPFVMGLLAWLKDRKKWSIEDWLLIVLLLVSPLAGAVTKDYFSTLRVLPMFLVVAWIIAKGVNQFDRLKLPVVIIFTFFGVTTLYYNCVLLRFERNKEWLYPYRDLAIQLNQLQDKPIALDNSRLKPFYIYYAYVNKINPKTLQNWHNLDISQYYASYLFTNEMSFFNLQIKPLEFRTDIYKDIYLVADEMGISTGQAQEHFLTRVAEIKNLDGSTAFNIYQTNPLEKCRLNLIKTPTELNPLCANILNNL